MSKIEVSADHDLDDGQLRDLVEEVGQSLIRNHGGYVEWQGKELHYHQSMGVHGVLWWDTRQLHVNVKLGMMASMFRGVIESEIGNTIDRYLG